MSIWLIRAGAHGEYELKFRQESRVFVTWDALDFNLAMLPDRGARVEAMNLRYPGSKPKAVMNWVSQIWPIVTRNRCAASSRRSRSPPGSMMAACKVSSSQTMEQFCWNGVTGMVW